METIVETEVHRQETIDQVRSLLMSGQVDEAKAFFRTEWQRAKTAMEQYDIKNHDVVKQRHDIWVQPVRNEANEIVKEGKWVKQWRLPLPYQKKIVNSAVAFLFGKGVNLIQVSKGTDRAFEVLDQSWRKMRLDSMNRELSRFLFKETEVARLYYVDNGDPQEPELKCLHLSNSNKDTLYSLFDVYKSLKAFARGYRVKAGEKAQDRFDVYMADYVYFCTRDGDTSDGWAVERKVNPIGKIPLAYYEQPETEWNDVQPLIERLEWLASTRGDVNDATADPILILEGDVISLPDRQETAKVVQLDIGGKATYLSPNMSVEMVKDERNTLKREIHYCTDTPDLSMDAVGGVDGRSGEAIKMLFFSAMLKALSKQEIFAPMLDREINIQIEFFRKFIRKDLADEFSRLEVSIEFGNPMPDSLEDMTLVLGQAVGGKFLSREAANKVISSLLHIDEEKEAENLKKQIEEEEEKEAFNPFQG